MHVVATAGHVDHGKSTLVRALTGTDPDRLAEEKRRGLTIDLGFAWTTTASGEQVAFVDVPGHERFIANMLAGLGPAPSVILVLAADQGWQQQSSDHRDAIAALGIEHALLVVTRSDLAPERVDEVIARAREELAGTGLADAPSVVVSGTRGTGLEELRAALDLLVRTAPPADPAARLRMWIDRSFTVKGSGTVVTGTLGAGTIAVGDHLRVGGRPVVVRGLESLGQQRDRVVPTSRVAVNLRGVKADEVGRGVALVRDDWPATGVVDVRLVSGESPADVPTHLVAHVGTASAPVRVRPLGDEHARLTFDQALPLVAGDRVVLRDPGQRIVGGVQVLDPEPPPFHRRGAATRRADDLAQVRDLRDPAVQVERRGAVRPAHLAALGFAVDAVPPGVRAVSGWWVTDATWARWVDALRSRVAASEAADPLGGGLSVGAAVDLLDLPDDALLAPVAQAAGVRSDGGRVTGEQEPLAPIAGALQALTDRLQEAPFDAPTAEDLDELGLGARELAAAERASRIVRLPGGVVLLPNAPALAMRALARLEQPFTASQARQALDSSRRVVIPLLELLDAKGWTRQVEKGLREVRR